MKHLLLTLFCVASAANAAKAPESITLPGLQQPVEILRDKWGVPHIYAKTQDDLFFAQGFITARDRLFQLDLWRRINTGRLSEIQGPAAIPRDRIARLVRYRGDWQKEWTAYSPDAKQIIAAFTRGINAYIDTVQGQLPLEFRLAGYAPAKWVPEDCVARIAGLLMTRNLVREVDRAIDVRDHGIEESVRVRPPDPFIRLEVPKGLDLTLFSREILRDYVAAIGSARIDVDQGSNNWVIDGSRSATGKPILANDPHRPINIPSLRKTVHLVGPGWNAIGAGEPALPGIALGHNEEIAFGFTIVGIDQADLYVETLNPSNPDEYMYQGKWRKMEIERDKIPVKGRAAESVDLRYTIHGPVLYEDRRNHRAFALKWVGAEPGGAGYLSALAVSRTKNWKEFRQSVAGYKVPSENIVYADRAGNIGWVASGYAPIRKNWTGLFPVPGDKGEYEWSGYLSIDQHPQAYNPPSHYIATANHNILPKGYSHQLSYEWAAPFRYQRIVEMFSDNRKYTVADFERMQHDITNTAAKRFQQALRKHVTTAKPPMKQVYERILRWDARMAADSVEAALFSVWMSRLPEFLIESPASAGVEPAVTLALLEKQPDDRVLRLSYDRATVQLEKLLGKDQSQWQWGKLHTIQFDHPLRVPQKYAAQFNRGPMPRPGDGNTVNAASGTNFRQTNGPSYRQIIDVSDWDRSVMTNVPGESGDPSSPFYSNLLDDWNSGRYHPMPYTRKAVEAATAERIVLSPK